MASVSARKYAASIATVTAITEKMQIVYGEKNGCSELKINLRKTHKRSWEYLKESMKGFKDDDVEKVSDVIAKVSEHGLDNTRSWLTLLSYMTGLLECRLKEFNDLNIKNKKRDMVFKLLKMSETLSQHFTSRMKRTDFIDDGAKLVDVFESYW